MEAGLRSRFTPTREGTTRAVCIPPPTYEDESVFPGNSKSIHTDFASDNVASWTLGAWDGFLDEVRDFSQQLPRTGSFYSKPDTTVEPISDASGLAMDLQDGLHRLGRNISAFSAQSVVGWPDICVEWRDKDDAPALLVGIVELDTLPAFPPSRIREDSVSSPTSQFWPVLNRLREMLALSGGLRYGFVTTRTKYWFCYGDETVLALSPPVDVESVTLACFWYLMALSEGKEAKPPPMKNVWNVGRTTDFTGMQDAMKGMVKDLATTLLADGSSSGGQVHEKLEFWSSREFELGRRLYKFNCDILYAKLRNGGDEVVLKIRDLGSHRSCLRDELERFVKEVLAYKKLRRIQGRAIPQLRSYGFMSGGMFAVLVLSYGGQRRDFHALDAASAGRYGEEAARTLHMIHHQGLVHGDLDTSSVVVRSEEPLRVTIVGLSRAQPAATAKEFSREMVRIKAGCGMTIKEARKVRLHYSDDDDTGDDTTPSG
ncbi:hypothetical protein SELMODRAFT_421503 [Selaginella moellendorffii]|uniref:Protein kinase domain-containing protein n=1 Tax=Selaginella moellendorffii TaxID=88036 RepID=D8SFH5_SELML|nr:hypothetical protein SELMODRAFT_421503 [Selaginella moellendorffii]